MDFLISPSSIGDASINVPGDKSISHRSLMLGSIAEGRTDVSGFLAGEDCLATFAAMRQLGVEVQRPSTTEVVINGVGRDGLQAPASNLDLGNSGTAMRLMAGLLSGQRFDSTLLGDTSLNGRPMGRIIRPLELMGARIESEDGTPPLHIRGNGSLLGVDYEMPVASAQVKSAVLLAGMYASGTTSLTEPATTRDHTERMLVSMGGKIERRGATVALRGGQSLQGTSIDVPGDLSSAAFLMLAAILAKKADILICNVGVNPTRTGVIDALQSMGADISLENRRSLGEEPVADIRVKSSRLRGGKVDPGLVSLAIDEFRCYSVAAAAAEGETEFSGIGELRVKESDRISAMADGMRNLGITVDESPDGAVIHGGAFEGGVAESHGDHRVAMSLAIAGTIARGDVTVRGVDAVDTSFPGFAECVGGIGMDIRKSEGAA